MNKYSRIKDRGLLEELEAYSFEVQEAVAHRRRKRQGRMIIVGVILLLAALVLNSIFRPAFDIPMFQGGALIVVKDELTAHPTAVLIDAARELLEKAKPGQVYIVKVSVEPL